MNKYKKHQQAQKKYNKLVSLKNVDSNKVEISDGQDIYMDKIDKKIREIYNAVIEKEQKGRFEEHHRGYKAEIDSKELLNLLKNIETHLDKLIEFRKEYMKGDEKSQKALVEIEKRIQEKNQR